MDVARCRTRLRRAHRRLGPRYTCLSEWEWMQGMGTRLLQAGLARLNPARWSQLLPEDFSTSHQGRGFGMETAQDEVVDELCRFLGTGSEDRPVRLEAQASTLFALQWFDKESKESFDWLDLRRLRVRKLKWKAAGERSKCAMCAKP